MANRHIKTINGRKYYYESIRKGKKVTSRYLGPAEERKRKAKESPAAEQTQPAEQMPAEESYIG
jgi:hypothetical protein